MYYIGYCTMFCYTLYYIVDVIPYLLLLPSSNQAKLDIVTCFFFFSTSAHLIESKVQGYPPDQKHLHIYLFIYILPSNQVHPKAYITQNPPHLTVAIWSQLPVTSPVREESGLQSNLIVIYLIC